jgi:hypothetical protein
VKTVRISDRAATLIGQEKNTKVKILNMKPLAEYTSLKNEICRKLENKLIEIP